ncbi:MAG TPA: DUF1810 domain-containing protein [Opitutaceae bacterium]|jgi:uncharacterized protein (DUF1810 family)|nr:DUF1810 domain-containing protein [Opitutaceae bacterium]
MQDQADRFAEFVAAQDEVYPTVLDELRAGEKLTHWMWFIFPQVEGLGHSLMARKFAIHSKEEALAFLAHRCLGPRLIECTRLVLAFEGKGIREILGHPDHLKFHSSMTLFSIVSESGSIFHEALAKFFDNRPDVATLHALK